MLHQCRNAACVWQCQLLEGGSGVVAWGGSSALNRVCFSDRVGGVGAVPPGPQRCWAAGGRWVSPWVLGPLWWGESAGGPQPALPLLCYFPVCRRLVLVSPLVPLEKAKLGGRGRRRADESGGQMGIRHQLQNKMQKIIGAKNMWKSN